MIQLYSLVAFIYHMPAISSFSGAGGVLVNALCLFVCIYVFIYFCKYILQIMSLNISHVNLNTICQAGQDICDGNRV